MKPHAEINMAGKVSIQVNKTLLLTTSSDLECCTFSISAVARRGYPKSCLLGSNSGPESVSDDLIGGQMRTADPSIRVIIRVGQL